MGWKIKKIQTFVFGVCVYISCECVEWFNSTLNTMPHAFTLHTHRRTNLHPQNVCIIKIIPSFKAWIFYTWIHKDNAQFTCTHAFSIRINVDTEADINWICKFRSHFLLLNKEHCHNLRNIYFHISCSIAVSLGWQMPCATVPQCAICASSNWW